MSYIDTINHSFIGVLAGIPVYHPLENDRDYNLTPNSIILGGGSGEHAIFVLKDINACVRAYICHYSEGLDLDDYYNDEVEHKSYWSIEDGYHFFESIKDNLKRVDIHSAEKYIVLAVAEYLLFFGEHLVDPELLKTARSLDHVPNIYAISDFPDGEPVYGKIIIDGVVKWGYTFEDEATDHNKKTVV